MLSGVDPDRPHSPATQGEVPSVLKRWGGQPEAALTLPVAVRGECHSLTLE